MNQCLNFAKPSFLSEGPCFKCFACYFTQNPDAKENSTCMDCDAPQSLWFCLDCAHIGCGRLERGHALSHYHATRHLWVMNLDTFQIWDYEQAVYLQHNLNDEKIYRKYHALTTLSKTTYISEDPFACQCPVCRYEQIPKLSKRSICMTCGYTTNLWLCLSCSHIGCGRDNKGHAQKHFLGTQHAQVMHSMNFSIWDYKEEKYLHRYINEEALSNVEVKSEFNNDIELENFQTIEDRLQSLENEWRNFCQLKETNKKMISIEQRLITLCEEKQMLEQKLREHDDKLSDLLNNFKDSNQNLLPSLSSSDLSPRDDVNSSSPSHNLPDSVHQSQAILFLVFVLFLYHFVNIFVQTISNQILKLN